MGLGRESSQTENGVIVDVRHPVARAAARECQNAERNVIQLENITKTYRHGSTETCVLRGISCVIPDGAFAFIVGPSGSGKSTLLYLMGALDDPTSGEIRLNDRLLNALALPERDALRRGEIGFIFQSFNLLRNLSALDNVLVPFLPTGTDRQIRPQAIALLDQVGLGHRLRHRPSQLSGGEQQRVAIARALLKQPRFVFADEPTGELDTKSGRQVFELLRHLNQSQGTTVVTVTHDERYIHAEDLVFEIEDGQIVS